MPFDTAGIFTRLYNWSSDRDTGIKILADRMDRETDGIVQAINGILTAAVRMRGNIRGLSGTVAAPGYGFDNAPGAGMYSPAAGQAGITGGASTLVVGDPQHRSAPLVTTNSRVVIDSDSNSKMDFRGSDAPAIRVYDSTGAQSGAMQFDRAAGVARIILYDANGQNPLTLLLDYATGELRINGKPVVTMAAALAAKGIGTLVFAKSTAAVGYGDSVAGSTLVPAGQTSSGALSSGGTALTGMWEARGQCSAGGAAMFIRTS